jgi:hypothetical protein
LRKVPGALAHFREALTSTHLTVVPDPSPDEVSAHRGIISDESDVPTVLAAVKAGVDYLVTHSRSGFLDDPGVAARTRLRVRSPGDALAWISSRTAEGRESCEPGQAAGERAWAIRGKALLFPPAVPPGPASSYMVTARIQIAAAGRTRS